jgi:hypothetical protein
MFGRKVDPECGECCRRHNQAGCRRMETETMNGRGCSDATAIQAEASRVAMAVVRHLAGSMGSARQTDHRCLCCGDRAGRSRMHGGKSHDHHGHKCNPERAYRNQTFHFSTISSAGKRDKSRRAKPVCRAEHYRRSSAAAHCGLRTDAGWTKKVRWRRQFEGIGDWSGRLAEGEEAQALELLRYHAEKGLPCGSGKFVRKLEQAAGDAPCNTGRGSDRGDIMQG